MDLVLIQETKKRFLDRYEGILRDIVALVHCRDVDLLIYTPREFAEMTDRRFIQTIMKEIDAAWNLVDACEKWLEMHKSEKE